MKKAYYQTPAGQFSHKEHTLGIFLPTLREKPFDMLYFLRFFAIKKK